MGGVLMPTFIPVANPGATTNPWNLPHAIEIAGESGSYNRNQLAGMIKYCSGLKSRYVRFSVEFTYYFRLGPGSIYPGNLLDWYFYSCFQYGVIPMPILNAGPNTDATGWTSLLPPDGRFLHKNKPEPEHQTGTLGCWRLMLDILAREADRVGCPRSWVHVQNGNELGKGGSSDYRPYTGNNTEIASPEGRVPSEVVTFRSALLDLIREYGFTVVSPAMECQDISIMQEELESPGWADVLNAHDIIAIHSYPELQTTAMNRGYASYAAGVAFNDRVDKLRSYDINLPVWVTEIGHPSQYSMPTGPKLADIQAHTCRIMGADEAFPFVLTMNGNSYSAYSPSAFSETPLVWPGI